MTILVLLAVVAILGGLFMRHSEPGDNYIRGTMTVDGEGREVIHVGFHPHHVSAFFTDDECPRPSCEPMEEDIVKCYHEKKAIVIEWSTSSPRSIEWRARK